MALMALLSMPPTAEAAGWSDKLRHPRRSLARWWLRPGIQRRFAIDSAHFPDGAQHLSSVPALVQPRATADPRLLLRRLLRVDRAAEDRGRISLAELRTARRWARRWLEQRDGPFGRRARRLTRSRRRRDIDRVARQLIGEIDGALALYSSQPLARDGYYIRNLRADRLPGEWQEAARLAAAALGTGTNREAFLYSEEIMVAARLIDGVVKRRTNPGVEPNLVREDRRRLPAFERLLEGKSDAELVALQRRIHVLKTYMRHAGGKHRLALYELRGGATVLGKSYTAYKLPVSDKLRDRITNMRWSDKKSLTDAQTSIDAYDDALQGCGRNRYYLEGGHESPRDLYLVLTRKPIPHLKLNQMTPATIGAERVGGHVVWAAEEYPGFWRTMAEPYVNIFGPLGQALVSQGAARRKELIQQATGAAPPAAPPAGIRLNWRNGLLLTAGLSATAGAMLSRAWQVLASWQGLSVIGLGPAALGLGRLARQRIDGDDSTGLFSIYGIAANKPRVD